VVAAGECLRGMEKKIKQRSDLFLNKKTKGF